MVSLPAIRSLLLTVGVVLAFAAVAAGVAGTPATSFTTDSATDTAPVQTSIAQPNGTSNYLQVPTGEVLQSELHRASVDVTASTRSDSDSLEIQLAVESFQVRYENADTVEERTAAVRDIVRTLDNHTEQVHQRQQTALARYNRGEITTNEFLASLTRADLTSEAIVDAADTVLQADDGTLEYEIQSDLETRLQNYEASVLPTTGRIRTAELRPAITGFGGAQPTYVETGDGDIVLATLVNDRYFREGVTRDARDTESSTELTVSGAIDRMTAVYPWVMDTDNREGTAQFDTLQNGRVFNVYVSHDQGDLDVYLDAATTDVFKEQQTRDPATTPVTTTVTNGTEDVALKVNATHETGPLEVTLTRAGTDGGVDGSIYVDDTLVGTTGADGHLWTLDTRGATEIRATTDDGETVTIRIENVALAG